MKLVVAIIQPTKLNAVREALEKIEVTRLTVCDGQGFGRRQGQLELFRGRGAVVKEWGPAPSCNAKSPQNELAARRLSPFCLGAAERLLRKVVLEIVVNDDFLERTVETIVHAAHTGPAGAADDGNVFVLPADQAIAIDDSARGPGAV